jgi:hypothetical protein
MALERPCEHILRELATKVVERLPHQFFPAPHVPVDQGKLHIGLARDLAQGNLVHAPLGEQPGRRVQDRETHLVRAARRTRRSTWPRTSTGFAAHVPDPVPSRAPAIM